MRSMLISYALGTLVCLGLGSVGQATIVEGCDEWLQPLEPGQIITCVAHFIPDVPAIVPETIRFTKAPEWSVSYPFDYISMGWDVAVSENGKVAYLYGPAITNDTSFAWELFSYSLSYQWDDADDYYDENNPVWVDIAVFNNQDLYADGAVRGIPGGPWDDVHDDTWKEQFFPGSGPYQNPVPEPATVCLLGLGGFFLTRRRR